MSHGPPRATLSPSRAFLHRAGPLGLLVALLALPARGGEGYAQKILAARDANDKGLAAVKGRKQGIDAASTLAIVQREKLASVAALVVGMYLEKGEYEGSRTLAVLKAFAARKGLFGKAATLAAWSPHMAKIARGLAASRSEGSRLLAAHVVAVYAHGESLDGGARKQGKKGKKRGGQGQMGLPNVDVEPLVAKLLADRSSGVKELALLAAAYAKLDGLADAIAGLQPGRSAALAGARLFALARLGRELPEEATRSALGARVRLSKRYATLSPFLHSYDLRGHALLYACQAVGAAADGRFVPELHRLLGHRDLRVQMEAARAIERIASHESVAVLLKKLDARSPWPVKVAVLSALGAIPDRASIEPLFRAFESERGRFRQDAAHALLSVCPPLSKLHAMDWRRWWGEHGDAFRVDLEATAEFRRTHRVQDVAVAALAEFYGGKIISDRCVFVLDTSMSMKGEKIKELKVNIAATLGQMPDHMRFNVVDFGGVVRVMKPGALISARGRDEAKNRIDYMDLSLGTRTFDAMEAATRLPGMDTLMYLSDGAPVAGQFEAWPRIVRAFDLHNRYRPIAMHCILYAPKGAKGAGGGKGRAGGMKQLADHNAGLMTIAGQGDAH